jgi:DNA-binding transcriptional MocR family regulator
LIQYNHSIVLDQHSRISGRTAAQISASLETGIRDGFLQPGMPLPTVRALARQLGVSPATATSAYRLLRQRGLLLARGRHGTRVAQRPPVASLAVSPPSVPRGVRDLASGNPDPALLPSLQRLLARADARPRLYGESGSEPRLLQLASAAFQADGVSAEALSVTGGALDAIERLLLANLRTGDRVALEDPTYSAILDLVAALGLAVEPVAVDALGARPDDLDRALRQGVVACLLTPRAHNPTGAALDAPRGAELRAVLSRSPATLVVVDDHAAPVAGQPFVDPTPRNHPRWAVVRSVSKSLGPDLRLGMVAGDPVTIARVEGRRRLGVGWVSHLLQNLVAGLWSDPATEHLLQHATQTYAARRAALVDALAGHSIAVEARSGLNIWIPVPEEVPVVQAMQAAGWAIRAGEPYRVRSRPAVRVTISRLEESDAPRVAAALAACLRGPHLTRVA